jgi:GNAT superfamily N-acetyltransferase
VVLPQFVVVHLSIVHYQLSIVVTHATISCMTTAPLQIARPLLIRAARLSDAAALRRACFPKQPFDQLLDYLEWCLAQENRPTRLVALDEVTLVGHVEVTLRHHSTDWAEVSSLVVASARRGEGIGRRLVGAAQRLARRWNCTELRLQVAAREHGLIAMYQQWGFTSRGLPINGFLWMTLPLTVAEPAIPLPEMLSVL